MRLVLFALLLGLRLGILRLGGLVRPGLLLFGEQGCEFLVVLQLGH